MQRLAQGTAERLVAQGIIREEDVPIYRYGLEAMYSSLLELLSILALAALIGNFWQTVLFFAAFIPLRLYAGGYHASTRLRCFLTSLVVYAAFTIMLEIVPVAWFVPLAFIGGAVSFLIVWLFAPVIHQNHPESSQWSETPSPVPKDQHQDLCGRSICYHRWADSMVRKCIDFRCFAGLVGRSAVHIGSEISIC